MEWKEQGHGERFQMRRKRLGVAAGSQELGCSLYELPPGKRPFPAHWHSANEEAMFVLAGQGTLRLNDQRIPIGPGDYVALRSGPSHVHQVINDGKEPLKFLAFSTMVVPDVIYYPDSKKVYAMTGRAPSGAPQGPLFLEASAVEYWEGED
jgi:uncharacterized cupin superfamily protein